MNAKMCDRCGTYYSPLVATTIGESLQAMAEALRDMFLTTSGTLQVLSDFETHCDLCPACRESFKKWFSKPKEEG